MAIWGIIVAAGSGSRFGGAKQFQTLGGRRVFEWSLDSMKEAVDGIVVVVPHEDLITWRAALESETVVSGGDTRSASVRAGLAAVPDDVEIVVVHDAARPLATTSLYWAVIDAVQRGADAAVPGIPMTDTIKRIDKSEEISKVIETVERGEFVAVQTPQAFRADVLRQAHEKDPDASDDAGLVEMQGGSVTVVDGDPRNVKITVPQDLAIARSLIGG